MRLDEYIAHDGIGLSPGMDTDSVFADLEPKETFTALFNATGQPAISLPVAQSRTGLPVGIQLASRFGREDMLLAVARQLEEGSDRGDGIWNQGKPGVHASTMELA